MLSFPEILVILLVAVIVFGPKRLPEVARKVGKWSGALKRAGDEFKRQLMTMDQVVDTHLAQSQQNLDNLIPTDEMDDMDQSLREAFDPSQPPTHSDELGEAIPGGLPEEEPAAEEAQGFAEAATHGQQVRDAKLATAQAANKETPPPEAPQA